MVTSVLPFTRLQPQAILMHHSSSHPDPTPHLHTVHQVGMMLAQAVFHGDNISIRFAPSLLKQVRESMTMHFTYNVHMYIYMYMYYTR